MLAETKIFEMRSCPFCRVRNTTGLSGPALTHLDQGLEIEMIIMVWCLSASGYCSVLEGTSGMRTAFFLEANVCSVCLGSSVPHYLL